MTDEAEIQETGQETATGASRRAILAGGLVLAAASASAGRAQTAASGSPAAPRDFDAVAAIRERICNLVRADGYGVGVELPGGILDVTATAARLNRAAPVDVDDLLQNGRGAELQAILAAVAATPAAAVYLPQGSVRFAPLVSRPEKIICIGFNYKLHAEETNTPIPKAPPMFPKYNNCLVGHGATVKLPVNLDYQFDYETELVLVVGKECRNAVEQDALSCLAGYATGNDLSARGLQTITSQFTAGKAIDGFGPVGPWLGTRARVPDPHKLTIRTTVNGETRQDWHTDDMIYNCNKLIAYASAVMTLRPGDIIYTGTPQGVIFGQQKIPVDKRRWLRPGDIVVSELGGLGELQVTLS